jgi:hypothetical protein
MLARDKHSSLLETFVNCGRKKFYRIVPRKARKNKQTQINVIITNVNVRKVWVPNVVGTKAIRTKFERTFEVVFPVSDEPEVVVHEPIVLSDEDHRAVLVSIS